jgi:hypothetical protein
MAESNEISPTGIAGTSGLRFQTDLVSAEHVEQLSPKLTDGQIATLKSYGTTVKTSVGEVLTAAGDLTYDLMVVLDRNTSRHEPCRISSRKGRAADEDPSDADCWSDERLCAAHVHPRRQRLG